MWKYIGYLNIFQYCKFLKLLGHVMVLLVLAIVGFSWYCVVPGVYGPWMVQRPVLRAIGSALLIVIFSALVSNRTLLSNTGQYMLQVVVL